MTLGHKIILLFAFMIGMTFITFVWFMNQFNHHVTQFKASVSHDKQALEAERDRSLTQLKEKAQEMREETKDHLNKMEEGLLKKRQEAEAFNENFLQRQNQLFDKMDNFLGKSEDSSKARSATEK